MTAAVTSRQMAGKWRDIWSRFSGRGTYPHQLAFLLLIPLRSLLLSPRTLAARLHLGVNARVLELGPGPGFFSVEIARRLQRGHLCLVDFQREMLVKARRRIRRASLTNASFMQASADQLPFSSDILDVEFLVAVLGEVPDPGGLLAFAPPMPSSRWPAFDHRTPGRS